jgi:hypothetical protein
MRFYQKIGHQAMTTHSLGREVGLQGTQRLQSFMGFHSPGESARVLAAAMDYARQAAVAATRVMGRLQSHEDR